MTDRIQTVTDLIDAVLADPHQHSPEADGAQRLSTRCWRCEAAPPDPGNSVDLCARCHTDLQSDDTGPADDDDIDLDAIVAVASRMVEMRAQALEAIVTWVRETESRLQPLWIGTSQGTMVSIDSTPISLHTSDDVPPDRALMVRQGDDVFPREVHWVPLSNQRPG